jgi:hypothetical protein
MPPASERTSTKSRPPPRWPFIYHKYSRIHNTRTHTRAAHTYHTHSCTYSTYTPPRIIALCTQIKHHTHRHASASNAIAIQLLGVSPGAYGQAILAEKEGKKFVLKEVLLTGQLPQGLDTLLLALFPQIALCVAEQRLRSLQAPRATIGHFRLWRVCLAWPPSSDPAHTRLTTAMPSDSNFGHIFLIYIQHGHGGNFTTRHRICKTPSPVQHGHRRPDQGRASRCG